MTKGSVSPSRQATQQTSVTPESLNQHVVSSGDGSHATTRPVRIVGIGTSAGGLAALDIFLRNVPKASGLAFVVVQHLDPTQQDMLAELLQRSTAMPVTQVVDGTQVAADHVYVIPPNRNMSVLHGALHLLQPESVRGLRLPIDLFFASMAEDQGERAIGVILTGMGMDGTRGCEAIKGKAGATFVQDPLTAQFDGMPGSVIDAGLADVVDRIENLPTHIVDHIRNPIAASHPERADSDAARIAIDKILILLRNHTGQDFSQYKQNTVHRRIERRMSLQQISQIAVYVKYVQEHPAELDLLFEDLLIGVTSFFRDTAVWDALRDRVIPQLLDEHSDGQPIRIWVAGCSTGEEAYSLAIVFREAIERLQPARRQAVQIFATDLDAAAIATARTGVYPVAITADMSPDRLNRYFVAWEGGYRIATSIRETVIFAPHNVMTDPPFTKLDLVSCRNLLIYLTAAVQSRLLPVFHYSLNTGGVLILGSSETLGVSSKLYEVIDAAARIYRRVDPAAPVPGYGLRSQTMLTGLTTIAPERPVAPVSVQTDAERLLLQRFAPAAVLVNDKGDIIFVSGRTGNYLEPAEGKPSNNIFAMAREGLASALRSAFRKALADDKPVTHAGLTIGRAKSLCVVDLTVQVITSPASLRGLLMIVFTDVPAKPDVMPATRRGGAGTVRVTALERELAAAVLELQTTREEMQISQEEVNAANQELQSANEELQSTNEEMTTSKEETQSMNEELQTLNHELQARVDDLSRMTNDMKNLFDSTDLATVFLDLDLHVRLFTSGSSRIFKLIASDVGRSITDFASEVIYPSLADDAREVLRTLVEHEQSVTSPDGDWFLVRIQPYRTLDNLVDGVVITFTDVTASKRLEEQLRATQVGLEKHIIDQADQLQRANKGTPP